MWINSQLAEHDADYPRGQRVSLMSNHICSAEMLNKKYQLLSLVTKQTKQSRKLLNDKMGV